jgi:RNAse (barnase) inhibitor barstar
MNSIENLWDIIDRRVRRRKEKCKNVDELWEILKEK